MKLNLIIDGNYKLYSMVFNLHKTKTLYGDLYTALEKSLEMWVDKYSWNQVYFISDVKGTNWRREMYKEYKGTRKKDADIDWEFVHNTYEEFKRNYSHKKVKFLELSGLEADDIIHLLIRKTNEKYESNMIISSDADLTQLLAYSIDKEYFNIQYRDKFFLEKMFVPYGFKMFMKYFKNKEYGLLDSQFEFDNYLLTFYNNLIKNIKVEEIEKEKMLFYKIIHGDSGDNIKSVLITKTGIGEKGVEKIYDSYKQIYRDDIVFADLKWIDRVSDIVLQYKKVDDSYKSEVISNIKQNIKLVELNPIWIPKELKNKFEEIML
jgi:5'-3' exonuclease